MTPVKNSHTRPLALLAVLLLATATLAEPRAETLITPNYKDADLGQIVEAVSQVTGKNFIIDPRVKAQVTMLSATPMNPDEFYETFLAILQVHGFVAVQSGSVYKIIPDANARQVPANDLPDRLSSTSDELVTQVITLKSVSAAQIVPILRPLIPQYGHLAAYPPSNALIISDRANNVNRMVRIIERIDQSTDDEVEVIRLDHASASEVVRAVSALAQSAGGEGASTTSKIIADERTNSVLVGGEKTQRLRMRALIAHLDTPLDSSGGTQVRYLKYADAEKLATKLKDQVQATTSGGSAGGGGAAGGATAADRSASIWAEPATNALIVTATPKVMRQVMSVVDRLDIRRAQVLVEAIIVEISGDKSADLGVNWLIDSANGTLPAAGFVSAIGGTSIANIAATAAAAVAGASSSTTTTGTTTTTTATGGLAGLAASSVPTGSTFALGKLNKQGASFAGILRAVSGISNTNIISTPSVTTLDNQEATIKVVSEVPFLTGQYSNTNSTTAGTNGNPGVVNPFQTITRQDVGTILKITPQITDDATILLKIDQEVSSLAQGSTGAIDLITNKRTISTRVLADDGEVIVLGGLIEDNLLEGQQRVPGFSSIPLLGNLFKVRNTKKTKTNLLVFIRAKILVDKAQMATETEAKYNYARGIELERNKGDAQLLFHERQPTLPDLNQLAPRGPVLVTPKSGNSLGPTGAAPTLAPPRADPATGLVSGAALPAATQPVPRVGAQSVNAVMPEATDTATETPTEAPPGEALPHSSTPE